MPGPCRNRRRGYTFLGVLIVFVIIFVLGQNYFDTDTPDGRPWALSQTDRARSAAMAANYRTAQTQWFMVSEGRRLPIDRMRSEMDRLSTAMGSGGRYFVDTNNELKLTTMIETPRFNNQIQRPRVR